MSERCKVTGRECYGKNELPLLFKVSQMLNRSLDIKTSLQPVMEEIARYVNADRAMLTILNRHNANILVEVAYGIDQKTQSRGVYRIGEGVVGEVVKTGKIQIIPDISQDRRFLNRLQATNTNTGQDAIAFVCVPVKMEKEIVGTLSLQRQYDPLTDLADDARVLAIIGTMIAQAVRLRQDRLEEVERLKQENNQLQQALKQRNQRPPNIIGNSGLMQDVYQLIGKVAATSATVLIRGESGVGKELIAEAIHFSSVRANKSLIKVNCAALPETLIESELFGHEKGAFTGADSQRKGRFELAEGGSIFLDEIGDLPAPTQVKLLRILQQKEFERLGGTQTIKTNVRIITATNCRLEKAVSEGEFREDLYYRINVFPIYVPALRERISDIPILVDHFIAKINRNHGTAIKRISSSAIDMLMIYHWPGNIRELENCLERAAIMSTDGVIRSHNLPPTLQTAQSSNTETQGRLNMVLEKIERQMLIDSLTNNNGNITQAAKSLDITERMMGTRIKKYKLDPKIYKIHD